MSKDQQAVPYTQGQWEWVKDSWHGGYSGIFTTDGVPVLYPQRENDGDTGAAWFDTSGDAGDETLEEGDSRLIVAAVNSYARLGPDAVRLAERDILRESLEALQKIAALDAQPDYESIKHLQAHLYHEAQGIARAILAQLPEQP